MQYQIKDLKDTHVSKDIWVIGSGPSMNYVNPSFFDNKITIGVNRVSKWFPCNYIVAKDPKGFEDIKNNLNNSDLILSKHQYGTLTNRLNSVDYKHYIFDHFPKPNQNPMVQLIERASDKIIVSWSTITSAIHIAAYMGAKNIIICGHDCGTIDGKSTIDGYYDNIQSEQGSDAGYINWLKQISGHTEQLKKKLKEVYDCNIHSLNPFINFKLEGNKYE